MLFPDSEHASSLQDFTHSRSILHHEVVELSSNSSLLRVTLGKVSSEDLSPHLEDRVNDHGFTPWGVHAVIGATHLLPVSPESFLLLELPSCILRSFSQGFPWATASRWGKLGVEALYTTHFPSLNSYAVLFSIPCILICQLLKNALIRRGFSGTYLNYSCDDYLMAVHYLASRSISYK